MNLQFESITRISSINRMVTMNISEPIEVIIKMYEADGDDYIEIKTTVGSEIHNSIMNEFYETGMFDFKLQITKS